MGHYTFYVLFDHDDEPDELRAAAAATIDALMEDIGDENNGYHLVGAITRSVHLHIEAGNEADEDIASLHSLPPGERFDAALRQAADGIAGYIQSRRYIVELRSAVEQLGSEHEAIVSKSFSMALWNITDHLRRIEHGWQDAAVIPLCLYRPDAYAWHAYDLREDTDGALSASAAIALVDVHR